MWWAAILHHLDDDVDYICYCNVFVSLSSASGFASLKERIFQGIPFSGCFQIKHSRYGKRSLGIFIMFNV